MPRARVNPNVMPEGPVYPPGWGGVQRVLRNVAREKRRALFEDLVLHSGVQGGVGLVYLAELLRWHADNGRTVVPPSGRLGAYERALVERRARELLEPLAYDCDLRLPSELRGMGE